MGQFSIKLADRVFCLQTLFDDTEAMCRDYITDDGNGIPIVITPGDIEAERQYTEKEAEIEGIPVGNYSEGYLETTAVYRKIADCISEADSSVFHGALIEKDGNGYLFTAKSGTGKTTHIINWQKVYPDCTVVNGDKPIISVRDGELYGYGTPWAGKEKYQTNKSVKIKSIILLCRGDENRIEKIGFDEAFTVLLNQTYKPKNGYGIKIAVDFISKLKNSVEFYRLYCNTHEESAVISFEGMR